MKMSHQLIAFPRRRAWSGYDQPEAVPPGTFLFLALVFAFAMPSASKADSTYHYSQPTQPTLRDVVYSDKSPKEQLDLYLPAEKNNPAPLIIWIHGGHFQFGDKSSMPRRNFGPPPAPRGLDGPYQIQVPDVTALLAKGYAVASLNYRTDYRPGSDIYPAVVAAVQDAKTAVRFLRANSSKYHLDSNKFAVWGNSGGGYMATILAVTGDQPTIFDDSSLGNATASSAIQAAVIWYGAIDFGPSRPELRIVDYLSAAKVLPPFLIANGDADPGVTANQALLLHDPLLKAGAKSTLTLLPGAGHEDPAFMATQMLPTFEFLDKTFGR